MIFPEKGRENTDRVVELVKAKAEATGIKNIVVASTTGYTAYKLVEAVPECTVSVVTHCVGTTQENVQDMPLDVIEDLKARGCHVITAAHAMGGIGRAVKNKFSAIQIDEIIAHTLRIFGQGTKVAVEVALMAADAGAIRTDERIISVGGSAHGADTAVVMRAANTHRFFDVRVDEVICKPRVSGL